MVNKTNQILLSWSLYLPKQKTHPQIPQDSGNHNLFSYPTDKMWRLSLDAFSEERELSFLSKGHKTHEYLHRILEDRNSSCWGVCACVFPRSQGRLARAGSDCQPLSSFPRTSPQLLKLALWIKTRTKVKVLLHPALLPQPPPSKGQVVRMIF